MLSKKSGHFQKRLYKKAPSRFLLILERQSRVFKKLALLAFSLGLAAIFASWPQLNWSLAGNFFNDVWQKVVLLPQVLEKQTFAFFDWGEAELNRISDNLLVLDEEGMVLAAEAGQSAQKSPTPSQINYSEEKPVPLALRIEIPKLQVNESVSLNIDPNKASLYVPALKEGVAHALGSALPGEEKMIYIFGHSTSGIWNVEAYNAVFYQIKDLSFGDEIILHWQDEELIYRVIGQEVVVEDDVAYVNQRQDQDILLLQTCWPPGTTWQRLFVTAEPVSSLEQDMRAIFGEF